MKKYILTALLGVFGLFGFTSATNYTFVSAGVGLGYNPSSITFSSDISVPENFSDFIVSYSCESSAFCNLTFYGSDYTLYGFECQSDESGNIDFSSCYLNNLENGIPAGTYEVDRGSETAFNSIIITDGQSSGNGSSSSGIISGGSTMFGNIVNSVSSTIGEFIPYVIQVGLGIISAIIGFVAIKRLMNRVRAKVLSTFNSRKRR